MKAAVCRAFNAPLSIEEVNLAAPGPEEVSVAVAAVAICHSDIAYIDDKWGGVLPAVYGHEAAGVVTVSNSDYFAPGDRVIVTLIRACGACACCATGLETSCEGRYDARRSPITDGHGNPVTQGMQCGAFAEAVTVHQSQIHKAPDGMPLDVASLLACGVITGYGAVTNTAGLAAGESAVVVGAGGVGLNAIQGAALSGAGKIVAVDRSAGKLEIARRFGATHGVLADSADVARQIIEICDGRGADYAFVAVGAPQAFAQAPEYLAPGGAMVIVGMTGIHDEVSYMPVNLASMNQRFLGSTMGQTVLARDLPILFDHYAQGRLHLDELITQRYPLAAINEALDSTRAGVEGRNVVIVDETLL